LRNLRRPPSDIVTGWQEGLLDVVKDEVHKAAREIAEGIKDEHEQAERRLG
jgi:hypothetical protein